MSIKELCMTDKQHLGALKRLRALISEGMELTAVDSTTIGDRYTHCSWGLCSNAVLVWPHAEEHLFPDHFIEHGRVAPKYLTDNQMCPMDLRNAPDGDGCFYHCRVFQSAVRTPTAAEAVDLYNEMIKKVEEKINEP
jgi:hypothetical protein